MKGFELSQKGPPLPNGVSLRFSSNNCTFDLLSLYKDKRTKKRNQVIFSNSTHSIFSILSSIFDLNIRGVTPKYSSAPFPLVLKSFQTQSTQHLDDRSEEGQPLEGRSKDVQSTEILLTFDLSRSHWRLISRGSIDAWSVATQVMIDLPWFYWHPIYHNPNDDRFLMVLLTLDLSQTKWRPIS